MHSYVHVIPPVKVSLFEHNNFMFLLPQYNFSSKPVSLYVSEKDGDLQEEYDIYSDTSSVMASTLHGSHIGSQVSG